MRAGVSYALAAVERGAEGLLDTPPALRSQAGLAARSGVGLEVVLRRYGAGYALLVDFIVEEAGEVGLSGGELQRLLRDHAAVFDRIVTAVSEEYAREQGARAASFDERRAERVRRLLNGEPVDFDLREYDLDLDHLGIVAQGADAPKLIRRLAASLGCRLLLVRAEEGVWWGWLGAAGNPVGVPFSGCPPGIHVGLGEPKPGVGGWRLTHRQAKAALSVALRDGSHGFVRYAEVATVAAALGDNLLEESLRNLYLMPLAELGGEGSAHLETLRAYFGTSRNVSSAAAKLGVDRRTVASRLRAVERCLGRTLDECASDLEIALRLDCLDS